uniref:Uncharacterized protein n=1 Tax=Anguilla anguilla TaxID=7936 RepID=A0A0E9QVS7_ANGAN
MRERGGLSTKLNKRQSFPTVSAAAYL